MIKLICIPAQKEILQNVTASYTIAIYLRPNKWCISSIKLFSFQLATGGTESAVYKKMIAPFKNELPASNSEGFRRACAEGKYAYFGPKILKENLLPLPCHLVPLPDTSYRDPWAFIISKNSSYKGLINWRWDNKMNSIR